MFLDECERGEWKSWLKTQYSKNEDHGIQSHYFLTNRRGKCGSSDRFSLGGVQKSLQTMTVAMKLRCLLLRGKTRTHLDSILKSKVITLLTKVHIVKAMVSMLFPVVMYRYESWIIKNAECQRNWYFQIVLLEKILKESLGLQGYQPWIFTGRTEGLMLKLQCFGHLMQRADSRKRPW